MNICGNCYYRSPNPITGYKRGFHGCSLSMKNCMRERQDEGFACQCLIHRYDSEGEIGMEEFVEKFRENPYEIIVEILGIENKFTKFILRNLLSKDYLKSNVNECNNNDNSKEVKSKRKRHNDIKSDMRSNKSKWFRCPYCGALVSNDFKYCTNCGEKL